MNIDSTFPLIKHKADKATNISKQNDEHYYTRKQENEARRISYSFSCDVCKLLFVNQGGLNSHKSTKSNLCNRNARKEAIKITNELGQTFRYYFDTLTNPNHIIT